MHVAAPMACLAVLALSGPAAGQDWPTTADSVTVIRERMLTGLKGGETAIACRPCGYQDYTLEFEKYIVCVTPRRVDLGDSLWIMHKPASGRMKWTGKSPADLVVSEDAGWFLGLHDHFLFLDEGCCPNGRGLLVYDLSTGKRVLDVTYVGYPFDPMLRGGRWLTYLEDLGERGSDCPEAARWERDFGTGFEEEVWFDLRTLKVTRSGMISCSPRQ